jgi:membrane AbrB-like protein
LTIIFSLTGLIDQRPPAELIWAAQFFIGIAVGVKYVGVTLHELRRDVLAGLVYSLGLAIISAMFFFAISGLGLAPNLEIFLSFLPGGQGEMVVIAIIAGADLTYVVSHHLLRLVLVILIGPIVARLFLRR